MQAYQFLSMKIRKLAFGKICHMDCSTDIILEEKKKGSLIQTFFGTHSLPRIHFFRIRRKQLGGPVLEH